VITFIRGAKLFLAEFVKLITNNKEFVMSMKLLIAFLALGVILMAGGAVFLVM
jgi:hypothetical protein